MAAKSLAVTSFSPFSSGNIWLNVSSFVPAKETGARDSFVSFFEKRRRATLTMRIISFFEDEETIKKILLRLALWMPGNHDPPKLYKEHQYIPASKSSGPSDDITHDDYVLQMPYEDEYSHLTPYEDCI
ncbi:MAG: hypothetical protein WC364_04195 [Eubacteriales bacterium]